MPKYIQRYDDKWFSGSTPVNAVKASQTIGSGDNGTVTVEYDFVGTDGNDYTIEVVEGSEADVDLSAVLTDTAIVVTLGTDSESALDATKNTATLVAAAIDALTDISAEASGTGATALAAAEAEQDFAGGKLATKSATPCFWFNSAGTVVYFCEKPVSRFDESGWKSGTLTTV